MAKKSKETKEQKTESKKAPEKKDTTEKITSKPTVKAKAISYDTIVKTFESRFDYQAARTMTDNALTAAGIEKKDKYQADELKKLVDVIPLLDVRTTTIIEGLNALLN